MKGLLRHSLLVLALIFSASTVASTADIDYSFEGIKKRAEAGDISDQHTLGMIYENGPDVPQDYQQAVRWYTKAAEAGYVQAQTDLGRMYYLGKGVAKNYVLAHKWLNLSLSKFREPVTALLFEEIESHMTPAQVAEAQKLAREWKPKKVTKP